MMNTSRDFYSTFKVLSQENIKTDIFLDKDGDIVFTHENKEYKSKKSLFFKTHFLCFFYNFVLVFQKYETHVLYLEAIYNIQFKTVYVQKNFLNLYTKHANDTPLIIFLEVLKQNNFITFFNKYLNEKKSYISTIFTCTHYGHSLLQDFIPINFLLDKYNIHTVFFSKDTQLFGDYKQILKEYNNTLCYEVDINSNEFLLFCIENNLYFFKPRCQDIITRDVPLLRYIKNDYKKTNKKIILTTKHDYRYAINQEELYIEFINFLTKKFENITFYLHSYVKFLNQENSSDTEILIKKANISHQTIIQKCNNASIISLNNIDITQFINIIFDSDLYITPEGSMQHLVASFTKKGFVYSSSDRHINLQRHTNYMGYFLPAYCVEKTIIPTSLEIQECNRLSRPRNYNFIFDIKKTLQFLKTHSLL